MPRRKRFLKREVKLDGPQRLALAVCLAEVAVLLWILGVIRPLG